MPLIVLEGADGAGKSAQSECLASWLREEGETVHTVHFPQLEAPVHGELIAAYLRGDFGQAHDVNPYLLALLFAGDRWSRRDELQNKLQAGDFIICDRYYASNLAYQGAKVDAGPHRTRLFHWILHMELDYFKIPPADLTIYLDAPRDFTRNVCQERTKSQNRSYLKGHSDIHENDMRIQQEVGTIFAELGSLIPNYHRIDCRDPQGQMHPIGEIALKIRALVQNLR